ncbi:MAG: hypothetical protein DDT34_02256 [Firmicutes bacterium]|nr:hypothetical protein [Bacillota bacterium]
MSLHVNANHHLLENGLGANILFLWLERVVPQHLIPKKRVIKHGINLLIDHALLGNRKQSNVGGQALSHIQITRLHVALGDTQAVSDSAILLKELLTNLASYRIEQIWHVLDLCRVVT